MKNLNKYLKNKEQDENHSTKTTSVNLELKQIDFLRAKNLNLSLMVRDLIDELMNQDKEDL
tara:strand:+ start:1045 stop:1227 length:183 start_codon:yes stop_codon:yes gene_type:complete